jgi:hypothetical protein
VVADAVADVVAVDMKGAVEAVVEVAVVAGEAEELMGAARTVEVDAETAIAGEEVGEGVVARQREITIINGMLRSRSTP